MQDVKEVVTHAVNLSLTNLCYLMVLSLMTASLAHFIQYTLKPGEIFGRLGLLLNYLWLKNWRKKDRWKRPILKPLGLCVYCNGAWVFVLFFFLFRAETNVFALFLGLGTNYIFTKALDELV